MLLNTIIFEFILANHITHYVSVMIEVIIMSHIGENRDKRHSIRAMTVLMQSIYLSSL